LFVVIGLPGFALAASEETTAPTFYRDVLPLLQENCQECHRAAGTNYGGLVAPMALTTYEETRPWAKAIVRQVESGEMPPWDADRRHHGVFANERSLDESEIATLVRWAASGAPAGDPAAAPPPKVFANQDGWMIGEPDLVLPMPQPFTVGDDVADLYTAFYVDLDDSQLPEDMWITGFQCKPGSAIVHHFNAHILAPVDGKLPAFGGFPKEGELAPPGAGQYIGGTASGTDANVFPEGFGLLLKKGSRVTFDVHYHKEPGPGTAVTDLSHIGFKLTSTPPKRQLGTGAAGRGPLAVYTIAIPPGATDYKLGPVSRTFPNAVDIFALMPHMHMRGSAATFEAFYPDGTSEVLLHVPRYDFGWQTVYRYRVLKRIPAGTRIEFTAWYENTEERGARFGFDPEQTVTFGPESTDEMMMGFVSAALAVEDEAKPPAVSSGGN
jgi:hypothetical protein